MESERTKDAVFEAIAVMGKALASPRRLELLDLLAQGPRSVDELARASEQSVANASQHLQALHAAGLVVPRAGGHQGSLRAGRRDVLRLWLALRDTSAAQLAEVERAARDYLGEEVEANRPRRAARAAAARRRRPRRRSPLRRVRRRAHRGRAVDPAR